MLHTETEAKNRECRQFAAAFLPMAAQGALALHAPQQISVGFGACAASKCMGWRWAHNDEPGGVPRGYCGFAGEPAKP